MWIYPVVWLAASLICAILYRLGGIGKPFDTKYRDLGCPAVCIAYLLFLWHPTSLLGWLVLLPFFGIFFGALTTYWDFLFGYDNFYMHGFMCGLSAFPLYWAGLTWWAILIRAVICGIMMGVWSKWIGKDWLEEGGRGFILAATIPLMIF